MDNLSNRIAIYPGTFDPMTNGHVSLIKRGLRIFDKVIVAIAQDSPKIPMFTLEERAAIAREALSEHTDTVVVEPFRGLLVDYVQERGARVILRGLRAVSDFEYEFQMALMNRHLKRAVQSVFLITDYRWLYISSTIVKEAAKAGGDISRLVPEASRRALMQKLGRE